MTDTYEKRDTPVTFRTSERKAAWIRDRARVENMDTSEYIDSVLTEHLEDKERIRIPLLRTRDAAEVAKALETALTLVKPMIAMGENVRARRRTA